MNEGMPRSAARLALLSVLAVQAAIGYEWTMSGLTKLVRGGFPAGLADELAEKSAGSPDWFRAVIDDVLIPNARTVGYLTEYGELVIGIVLLTGAALVAFASHRLAPTAIDVVLAAVAAAALAAILMNVTFHLANGSPHPWLVPEDGFDEGVDLDSLMPFVELVIVVFSVGTLMARRRARTIGRPSGWTGTPEAPRATEI